MISISVMQSMTTKDYARILRCLRGGPKTCKEVADALKLSYPRANQLLLNLAQKRTIHSPRCGTNAKGRNINIWEILTIKEDP
jgi:predicted ArsR family transcriptional regulator